MRERFARFMVGRYGVDEFGRALLGFTMVILVVSLFFRQGIAGLVFNILILAGLIFGYVRMFSKNYQRRYAENQAYLRLKRRVTSFFGNGIAHMKQRKTHHIYSCPNCRQKIRIPRGKGRISITCPKCRNEFIKKS